MDAIDRKILALYQRDTRRTAESIGEAVGLSPAAVQRRLKRLREEGVVRAEVASLDPAAVGAPILCIVMLTLANTPAPEGQLARFKRDMQAADEVQQCYQVTGTADIVVVVAAAAMEAYGEFARRWFEGNPRVARYETHVVLDRVKTGIALPIAP